MFDVTFVIDGTAYHVQNVPGLNENYALSRAIEHAAEFWGIPGEAFLKAPSTVISAAHPMKFFTSKAV